MGGDNAPALPRNACHDLSLSPDQPAIQALEFQIGGGEIAPEGGDGDLLLRARRVGFHAGAKGANGFNAIKQFRDAIAHHARIIPEAAIQHRAIIGGDGGFVTVKHRADFGDDVGIIDFHGASPATGY